MSTFANGDRVVVESPVRLPLFDTARTRGLLGVSTPVGTLATVDFVDTDGEVFIKTDDGRESYVDPEGLLKVDDLDRLAAERAGLMPWERELLAGGSWQTGHLIVTDPPPASVGPLRVDAARTAIALLGTDALIEDVLALAKFLLDD